MTAPCKDCPNRHPLCHAECEQYLAYKAEREARREERRITRDVAAVRSTSYLKYERMKLNHDKKVK